MSMTPDAGSFFQPLNYTTSFTNPAAYNNASLQNVFGQGQQTINDLYRSGGGFGTQTNYYSGLGAHYAAAGMSPFGVFSEGGGGGASPYQTSANVWDTGAAPFRGGGGSSGMGGSIFDGGFGGGIGSLGASPYQTTPNVFDTGARGFQYPGAGNIDWSGISRIAQNLPQSSAANFGAGMFSGLGGTGASPGAGALDWTKLYPSGGARTDPYPNMAMPGGLNQPMVTPQQQPQDFGSLFGRSVGGTAGAPNTPQPAAPSFDVAGKTAQPSLTDYGATPSLDFTKLFSGNATAAPAAAPGAASDTAAPTVSGRNFSDYYYNPDLYAPSSAPAGAGGGAGAGSAGGTTATGVSQDETQRTSAADGALTPGGGLQASDLSDKAREQLRKLMAPKEPTPDEVFARDKPVPTEGQPGVPLPRERPAEAPAREAPSPATELYPAADVPRPPGEIFPAARLARSGQAPEAFIVHHTEGRPTLESMVQDWRVNPRSQGRLGTQYFMDREGGIHDIRAETGYTGLGQTYDANQPGTIGLTNRNIVGMEISARNDQDVTPAQRAALVAFMAARYPDTPAYGHKEIEGGKGEAEGFTGARDILQSRPPLFNFDWSNAPVPVPAQTVVDPITGRMGPNPNLGAGASAAPPRAGGFGESGEFSGQLPGAGAFTPYPGWRESPNVDIRADEQPGRAELTALQARGFGYDPNTLPEPASTPLGRDLGLLDRGGPDFNATFDAFKQPAEIEGEAGRGGMTGRAELASLVADPNRKSMTFGGGFSPSPELRQGGVGPEMGAPTPEFMQTIAKVESDFNPNNVTGKYKGLYQLSDEEFRRYGGKGSIFDPDENARVATLKMMDEGQKAQDRLGRALTPPEQYMVHQQGLYGTLAHLANPDQIAWKSFQQASGNSEERSKTAIWKNMTPAMKAQFNNDVSNVTSRDFIKIWADHYNELQRKQ